MDEIPTTELGLTNKDLGIKDITNGRELHIVGQNNFGEKAKRFGRKIKGIFSRKHTQNSTEPDSGLQIEIPNKNESKNKTGLQELLENALAVKNIKSPEFKSEGVSYFLDTNEKFDPSQFEEVRNSNEKPDGYIIGVGTSSIFTALDLFSKEAPPKGVVLLNIDPATVKEALMFVEKLKMGKLVYSPKAPEFDINSLRNVNNEDQQNRTNQLSPVELATWKNASLLMNLALDGKIAIIEQNIFNQDVLQAVKSTLPNFSTSTNVIYLSNIGDWIRRKWLNQHDEFKAWVETLPEESRLRALERHHHSERLVFSPYWNLDTLKSDKGEYFIDSSETTVDNNIPYKQRINRVRPSFINYIQYRKT